MGIESDQLVFDYLSRVGDLAQQQQLSSQTRMALVSSLRGEIERQRAKDGSDGPAAVRRILDGLGAPDEVVAAAAGGATGGAPAAEQPNGVPEQRTPRTPGTSRPSRTPRPPRTERASRTNWRIPRPRGTGAQAPEAPAAPAEPPGPHMIGMDEMGPTDGQPDWWRIDEGPFGPGDIVPGFRGGVEIPEMLKPPPKEEDGTRDGTRDGERTGAASKAAPAAGASGVGVARRLARLVRRSPRAAAVAEPVAPAPAVSPAASFGSPMLLLAAGLLVAGAVLGSWLALAGGWLLAYASRRLSRAEAKWVVLGLPGLVLAGGGVWLWGRLDGRWGEPIAPGGDAMGEALTAMWPWLVRGAAVASALYLVWRARRR
ncbi:hypothetical protein [Streptomyces sp. SP18CS02]|uniref:hypothetical protein n=1 Tax=Streptomyces sp. SP18CS02 TaxID=3002531 RepID=UPI002E790641|nr:hypothetical protein [Streptomyces sp. SP18CS02]MEE1755683.1 hypothetical protein [Streptomyces sp. SP18CS02]